MHNISSCSYFFISAPFHSAKKGKEKSFLFFNYYRSDVNILRSELAVFVFFALSVVGLAHRRFSAAPVLTLRSCRVGSHIRLYSTEYSPARI